MASWEELTISDVDPLSGGVGSPGTGTATAPGSQTTSGTVGSSPIAAGTSTISTPGGGGATSGTSGISGTSALSATPDEGLSSLLPLLSSVSGPETLVTDYTQGVSGSGEPMWTPVTQTFDPFSSTPTPYIQELGSFGSDKTTSGAQLFQDVNAPAWEMYNSIIQQYPDLAGKEINPDFIMQVLGQQATAENQKWDPEANVAAISQEVQDLLLNQPGIVADRGGYIDVSTTPQAAADRAASAAQAQANWDWMNKYGGGEGNLFQEIVGSDEFKAALIAASVAAPELMAADAGGDAAATEGLTFVDPVTGIPVSQAAPTAFQTAIGDTGVAASVPAAGTGLNAALEAGGFSAGTFIDPATGIPVSQAGPTALQRALGETGFQASAPAAGTGLNAAISAAGAVGAAPTAADFSPLDYLTGTASPAGEAATSGPIGNAPLDPAYPAYAGTTASGGVDPVGPSAPLGGGDIGPSFPSADYDTGGLPGGGQGLLPPVTTDDGTELPMLQDQGLPPVLQNANDPTYQGLKLPSVGAQQSPADYLPVRSGTDSGWASTLKDIGKWATVLGPPGLGAYEYFSSRNAMKDATKQLAATTAPATGLGTQLMTQAAAGQVTPGQQAQIDQWKQSSKATIKQYYQNAGQPDSVAERSAENYVDQLALGVQNNDLQANITSAIQALQLGAGGSQQAILANLKGDQALTQQILQFMQVYGNLLNLSGVFK
jgi:hypothetical protein